MTTIPRLVGAAACACLFFVFALPASGLDEVDWPQWRGPDRTGASAETGWSAVPARKPLWSKNIGYGHSSFVTSNGRLFAMGYDTEAGVDVIYCLDPESGQEQWRHTYAADFWNEGHDGGTCTTPTVEGGTVYASNREGKLMALRADTGSEIWSRDLRSDLGVTPPRWGFAGSPVIVGETVYANVSKVAAFDKATGETKWVSEKAYGNAYSTPIEYEFNGRPSLLVLNGLGLAVIDRADGAEIAFHEWSRNPERAVYGATPVIIGKRIFISAAAQGGCAMLEPNAEDGLDVVWESRVMRSSYAGCVLHGDHLYGFDASILKCIDLEGNEKWRQRGIGVGAMLVVGDRLLVVGAKGELIVAEANPDAYVELSRVNVLEGGANWATPILSHGLVYARNSLGDMVCQDHRVSAGALADAPIATPDSLPEAAALLAAHVEAIGGPAALRRLSSVHMTGLGESQGAGPIEHCDAELAWSKDHGFVWSFSTGQGFGYNATIGWSMLGMAGPEVLERDAQGELREVGDLLRILEPTWGFASVETVDARVFDDRLCYQVRAAYDDGRERTLFFEVATGLLAGHEGEDVPLWTFGDYTSAGGVLLPREWSMFAAGSGSLTMARFTDLDISDDDASRFEPPPLIAMMTRSDEEKERANEALREKYADLLGDYVLASGSMAGMAVPIMVGNGGLQTTVGSPTPEFIAEPDDEGRMFVMSNPKIYLSITRPESGGDYEIVLYAYGDEIGRLERAKDD